MKIIKKFNGTPEGCLGSKCPAFYLTDEGTFVVQGRILSEEVINQLELDENEIAVEIPLSLVKRIKAEESI